MGLAELCKCTNMHVCPFCRTLMVSFAVIGVSLAAFFVAGKRSRKGHDNTKGGGK